MDVLAIAPFSMLHRTAPRTALCERGERCSVCGSGTTWRRKATSSLPVTSYQFPANSKELLLGVLIVRIVDLLLLANAVASDAICGAHQRQCLDFNTSRATTRDGFVSPYKLAVARAHDDYDSSNQLYYNNHSRHQQ